MHKGRILYYMNLFQAAAVIGFPAERKGGRVFSRGPHAGLKQEAAVFLHRRKLFFIFKCNLKSTATQT